MEDLYFVSWGKESGFRLEECYNVLKNLSDFTQKTALKRYLRRIRGGIWEQSVYAGLEGQLNGLDE